jgi:hypothetical protein
MGEKREPTIGERLVTIREEHTRMLDHAITDLECDWCGIGQDELDPKFRMAVNRIAKDAIQQATAAVTAAYVREYERKDAAKAQAKQDRNMKLFNRPGRWGQE